MTLRETLLGGSVTIVCLFSGVSCQRQDAAEGVPATIPVLNLTAEPMVHIGVIEGAGVLELHEAVSSMRLSDDRIVVANAGSSELLFFDGSGRFLSKSGRRGGGPGEFQML